MKKHASEQCYIVNHLLHNMYCIYDSQVETQPAELAWPVRHLSELTTSLSAGTCLPPYGMPNGISAPFTTPNQADDRWNRFQKNGKLFEGRVVRIDKSNPAKGAAQVTFNLTWVPDSITYSASSLGKNIPLNIGCVNISSWVETGELVLPRLGDKLRSHCQLRKNDQVTVSGSLLALLGSPEYGQYLTYGGRGTAMLQAPRVDQTPGLFGAGAMKVWPKGAAIYNSDLTVGPRELAVVHWK